MNVHHRLAWPARLSGNKTTFQDFLKAEVVAKKDSDPSTQFKLYAKAYDWAYGDVFDRIHKENPDVDMATEYCP